MGTVAALHLRTKKDAYFLDIAGNLFITTDGGQTWDIQSVGLEDGWQIPELNHSAAMRFTDADHGLIALNIIGEGNGKTFVLRTEDGGQTWLKENLPVQMGMFHLTRDGYYLTHVDLLNHGKFTLLRSTRIPTGERIPINRDLTVRQIQDEAFVFSHTFPWEANSLAVVMGNHLVLVDTPYTPEATREMLIWLEDQLGPKQVAAINTHFHLDNLGGNQYLIEQGIPVYGSNLTAELLEERGQSSLEKTVAWLEAEEDPRFAEAFKSLTLTPPSELFDLQEGLSLTFEGKSVQVYYPGTAHAPDNVVVYFPERKLLFGGCMIIGWDAIGNTADADLAKWPESVRNLMPFEFDILVPGHGERLDPGLLDHTLAILIGQP
jgi:glyoxylase-like metal-dependent hydrolase (beta-lactamase superfamily II)